MSDDRLPRETTLPNRSPVAKARRGAAGVDGHEIAAIPVYRADMVPRQTAAVTQTFQ